MRRPLQAILIGGYRLRDDVLNERKRVVIREGHRDYVLGSVLIGCDEPSWGVAKNIIEVKHTTIGEVTRRDSIDHGFVSREQMLNFFKVMYPESDGDLKVTVIRWITPGK